MFKKIFYLIIFVLSSFSLSWAGRISIFLNLYHNQGIKAVMEIDEIGVKGETGYQKLELKHPRISTELPFGQILIATDIIPSGKYEKLKLKLRKVYFKGKKIKILQKDIEIPIYLEIKKGDSKSLFINWNVAESLGNVFFPSFSVSSAFKPLPGENLFVISKDTVWVIDPNSNQVIYSFGITGDPQGVAADFSNKKIYVVCKKERVIKVIDMNSFQIVEIIPIPLLKTPQFIALGEKNTALITSSEDCMLLSIDLSTGEIISKKRVNFIPYEVSYIKDIQKFIVSAYDEEASYLYDRNLYSETRITGGFKTDGFISDGQFLYITDTQGGIYIYTLPQLQYRGKLNICESTLRGVFAENRIFITCKEGKVVLINQGIYVGRIINIAGEPFAITYLPKKKWIYVGFRDKEAIGVIDMAEEKFIGDISIGEIPDEVVAGN